MSGQLLSIRGVSLRRGDRAILSGLTLEVARGEAVALMASSGGGKTTVLRIVAGLTPFDEGSVEVGGVALESGRLPRGAAARALRREVGLVFQQHHLFDHLPALENVTLAPVRVLGAPRRDAEERALHLLASLGVDARARAFPRELSGGEAQRVAVARSLAMDPPLLLMDEPTASLDPARRGDLAEALSKLVADGRTLFVTTHDVEFAGRLATRVVILADGAIVEEGRPDAVLARPVHPATRRLLQSGRGTAGANRPRERV